MVRDSAGRRSAVALVLLAFMFVAVAAAVSGVAGLSPVVTVEPSVVQLHEAATVKVRVADAAGVAVRLKGASWPSGTLLPWTQLRLAHGVWVGQLGRPAFRGVYPLALRTRPGGTQFATAAGIPGSDAIPDDAQLFLGFTSTQRSSLGPTRIANVESLRGVTDQWPGGYFRHGTVMHLSHLFEDLEDWYSNRDFLFRVWATFRPGITPPESTRTLPENASVLETEKDVTDGFVNSGIVGHSASLQPQSRLAAATVDNYGEGYAAGTALVQRADFNTLDNPFGWTADKRADNWRAEPAAGLHFISFTATASIFERVRLAMDSHYPDGKGTGLDPRDAELGFNSILHTTHRQNFLVPPRSHRSFPLAEFA